MTDREAGWYWEQNAEVWTHLARQGWDIFRDHFNTPALLEFCPMYAAFPASTSARVTHTTPGYSALAALRW